MKSHKTTFRWGRLIALIVVMTGPLALIAQKSPVDKLFEKYANQEGFTTVNVSGALLSLASQMQENSPESDMLSNLEGVRILTAENKDLNSSLNFYKELEQDGFFRKNDYQALMEVTEKDKIVRFYGKNTKDKKFSELLMVIGGNENVLISIRGLIDPENIAKLTKSLNIDINSGKSKD